MAIGEGCRQSFLVDDWGWQQVQEDFVAVNRERKRMGEKRENTSMLLICEWVVSAIPHHQALRQGSFLVACH